jgi:hypothetical protein
MDSMEALRAAMAEVDAYYTASGQRWHLSVLPERAYEFPKL